MLLRVQPSRWPLACRRRPPRRRTVVCLVVVVVCRSLASAWLDGRAAAQVVSAQGHVFATYMGQARIYLNHTRSQVLQLS